MITLVQLVITVAVGVAFPTIFAIVGLAVNSGRFNTIDGRLLHIETSLGDVRERIAKIEERLDIRLVKP